MRNREWRRAARAAAALVLCGMMAPVSAAEWRVAAVSDKAAQEGLPGTAGAFPIGDLVEKGRRFSVRTDEVLTLRSDDAVLSFRGPSKFRWLSESYAGQTRLEIDEGHASLQTPPGTRVRIDLDQIWIGIEGSSAWVSKTGEGERVCSAGGPVEVEFFGGFNMFLRKPGACVEVLRDTGMAHFSLSEDELDERIVHPAVDSLPEMAALADRAYGGAEPEAEPEPEPQPAPDPEPAAEPDAEPKPRPKVQGRPRVTPAPAPKPAPAEPEQPESGDTASSGDWKPERKAPPVVWADETPRAQPLQPRTGNTDTVRAPKPPVGLADIAEELAIADEGSWYVVLAAFSQRERSSEFINKLPFAIASHMTTSESDSGRTFRAAVGPFASVREADAARIRMRGHFPRAWLLEDRE
ncbi:SPOR domain-containing protein [Algiphilus sp.]|uniref:SPOR domain-containing protein n=1 Tax=Algiphilus sp. TaxID=1872431 RepID=UPI003C6581A6